MLTANAITELDVEGAVHTIFAEWLAKYFDGQPHIVGGKKPVSFPTALLQFEQCSITQPQNPGTPAPQASIIMVWGTPISTDKRRETVGGKPQQMIYKNVRWNFWVRAQMQSADSANARKVAHLASKRLNAILKNPATNCELGQKGIHHPCPREPELVAESAYTLMLVTCQAQLRYSVLVK